MSDDIAQLTNEQQLGIQPIESNHTTDKTPRTY